MLQYFRDHPYRLFRGTVGMTLDAWKAEQTAFLAAHRNWYDGAFKASLTVSMLQGEIDLIAQARFLFHTETYKKRIAKWDGFSSKIFEIVSKVGATPSEFRRAL